MCLMTRIKECLDGTLPVGAERTRSAPTDIRYAYIGILILSWYTGTFDKETNTLSVFVYNLFGTLTDIIDSFCLFVWERMEDECLDGFARKIYP